VTSTSFSEVQREVDKVAVEFLESYNQIDGIELVGGPFELNEYSIVNVTNSTNLIVDYKYIEKEGIAGYPSSFTIGINSGMYFSSSMPGVNLLISESAESELTRCGIRKEILPPLKDSFIFDSTITTIQMDPNGYFLRADCNIPTVNMVIRDASDNVLVFYNDTYNSSFFRNFLNTLNCNIFRLESDGSWNKNGVKYKTEYMPSPPTEKFLLLGTIGEQNLLSLIRLHQQMYPGYKILAVLITPANQAFIYEGDLDTVTKWLKSKPIAVAVLNKQEDWIVSKTIEIYNVDRYYINFPVQIFPLAPELKKDQLNKIRENITRHTQLDENDIMELIHYAYRLRGLSNHIISLNDVGPMEVEIKLGRYSGSIVKFKKINNKWLISGYSEYIR
jgi:hypothetical protein